jgi:hypothetical protein
MTNEQSGIEIATKLLCQIKGMTPTRVKLGYGSFINFDFGKDIEKTLKTRSDGYKTIYFGEWYIWVYMCTWRIDKNDSPLIGSHDPRELIEQNLQKLECQKLSEISIHNKAFDSSFSFGEEYKLHLFSCQVSDYEQWKFFTPERKVFVAGPGATWSYHNSNQTRD